MERILCLKRRRRRGRVAATVVLLAVAMGMAGCGGTAANQMQSGRQPLVIQGGSGGQSLDAPKRGGEWNATVGDFAICLRDPRTPARIVSVAARTAPDAAPKAVTFWDAAVRLDLIGRSSVQQRRRMIAVGSAIGWPADWNRKPPYRGPIPTRAVTACGTAVHSQKFCPKGSF